MFSFIHSHVTSLNDFLHADCGLFLHPAANTAFPVVALDFQVNFLCDKSDKVNFVQADVIAFTWVSTF